MLFKKETLKSIRLSSYGFFEATKREISQSIFHLGRIVCLSSLLVFAELPAHAEWTDRNRLAAEAWRVVDKLYLDRTFNGQDWFKLRQDLVHHEYTSDDECFKSIQAMLSSLGDKYTRYLTPEQYESVVNIAVGQLVGVGMELTQDPQGGTSVENVEEGSPAQLAGIMKGDLIVSVDSTDTRRLSPEEIAGLLRGHRDTKVNIVLQRKDTEQSLTLLRKPISVQSVSESRILPVSPTRAGKQEFVGYIKIRTFSSSTGTEVAKALQGLQKQATVKGKGITALVADLRDNSGGLLQGAVDTANIFLKPGKVVVYVVSGSGNISARLTVAGGALLDAAAVADGTAVAGEGEGTASGDSAAADSNSDSNILMSSSGNGGRGDAAAAAAAGDPSIADRIYDMPMFVLVNGNTASAAEVFAAALQENGRATLAGTRTFGKGIVQSLQELRQGGVAVTYARYETPSHRNIHRVGIPVDLELACSASSAADESGRLSSPSSSSVDACIAEIFPHKIINF